MELQELGLKVKQGGREVVFGGICDWKLGWRWFGFGCGVVSSGVLFFFCFGFVGGIRLWCVDWGWLLGGYGLCFGFLVCFRGVCGRRLQVFGDVWGVVLVFVGVGECLVGFRFWVLGDVFLCFFYLMIFVVQCWDYSFEIKFGLELWFCC